MWKCDRPIPKSKEISKDHDNPPHKNTERSTTSTKTCRYIHSKEEETFKLDDEPTNAVRKMEKKATET